MSFQVNQLNGFNTRKTPPARIRFVNTYAYTFPSAASVNVTVPIADLQFHPSDHRQILVFFLTEVPIPAGITIDGVAAPIISADGGPFVIAGSAYHKGTVDFTVTLTVGASSTEVGRIAVYEVEWASPLYESFAHHGVTAGLINNFLISIPARGVASMGVFVGTDTSTLTFSGMTEDADLDAGDFRLGAGSVVTPQAAINRLTGSVTSSASNALLVALGILPTDVRGVRGPCGRGSNITSADPTVVPNSVAGTANTGKGTFKLILTIMCETDSDVNGVTVNGVAMTRIGQVVNTTPSPDLLIEVWSLDIVDGSPSGDISIDWTAAPGVSVRVHLFRLYGVGAVGTAQTTSGNGTGNAVSVDTAPGGLILGFHIRAAPLDTVSWTGIDEADEVNVASAYKAGYGIRAFCDAETGRSVQPASGSSGEYATLAIAFNPF